jgi:hypothetical protein
LTGGSVRTAEQQHSTTKVTYKIKKNVVKLLNELKIYDQQNLNFIFSLSAKINEQLFRHI